MVLEPRISYEVETTERNSDGKMFSLLLVSTHGPVKKLPPGIYQFGQIDAAKSLLILAVRSLLMLD